MLQTHYSLSDVEIADTNFLLHLLHPPVVSVRQ